LDRWCIVVFVVVGFRKMSISREELLRIIHKSKKLIRPSTLWDGVNVRLLWILLRVLVSVLTLVSHSSYTISISSTYLV
jgi:hypothetical protein